MKKFRGDLGIWIELMKHANIKTFYYYDLPERLQNRSAFFRAIAENVILEIDNNRFGKRWEFIWN